ncbi:MAG: hypothetical protein GY797_20125 [Deltaproteobacteria bacterium]|nr:hypothetical protein [Deltaproteobacteria bacterium]
MIEKKFFTINDYIPSDSTFRSRAMPSLLSETSSREEQFIFIEDEINPNSFKMVITEQGQHWYWLPDWQKMEDEADQNLKDGDYEDFDDIDEFVASL